MEHQHTTSPHSAPDGRSTAPMTPTQLTTAPPPEKEERFWSEIIRFAIIALIIVVPIRMFVAQPFVVSGASMEPAFEGGQYLIVDQVTYRFEEPERGDVIIFRYPRDPSKFFIKRIIGLPGETVHIEGQIVSIQNGENTQPMILAETYVHTMRPTTVLTQVLGNDEYFVMGDNRDASSDSRAWGALSEELIVGRAFARLLPINELDILPGDIDEIEIIR